jgi:hypothetical protein
LETEFLGMKSTEPLPEEVQEAKRNPNGWVYRISGSFGDNAVPPEAIVGAWQVDSKGAISGDFHPNPKFPNPPSSPL